MGPVVVNGSIHTACKQDQRKNIPICMCITLHILCKLAPNILLAQIDIRQLLMLIYTCNSCSLQAVWILPFVWNRPNGQLVFPDIWKSSCHGKTTTLETVKLTEKKENMSWSSVDFIPYTKTIYIHIVDMGRFFFSAGLSQIKRDKQSSGQCFCISFVWYCNCNCEKNQ